MRTQPFVWLAVLGAMCAACGDDSSGPPAGGSENTPSLCQDADDNDGDGFADCVDQDCQALVVCAPLTDAGTPPPVPPPVAPPPPTPPTPPPPPTACTVVIDDGGGPATDSCASGEICIMATGRCQTALSRRYSVIVAAVQFPSADLDPPGGCWDTIGCGAPDPFVEVFLDGASLGTTPQREDVFFVNYDPLIAVDATLSGGSSLRLTAWDGDVDGPEFAFECNFAVTAELLRGRVLTCLSEDGSYGIGAVVFPSEDAR